MHATCSVHCTCSSLIFVLNSLFHIFQFLLISPSKCSRSTSLYRTKRCTTLLNSSNRSILTSIFFKFWQRGVPFNFCFFGVFFCFFLYCLKFHFTQIWFLFSNILTVLKAASFTRISFKEIGWRAVFRLQSPVRLFVTEN